MGKPSDVLRFSLRALWGSLRDTKGFLYVIAEGTLGGDLKKNTYGFGKLSLRAPWAYFRKTIGFICVFAGGTLGKAPENNICFFF